MDTKYDIEKRDSVDHLPPAYGPKAVGDVDEVEILNVSGHKQELDRSLGFWSICAVSIITDDAWAAGAGSLVCTAPIFSLSASKESMGLIGHFRLSLYMMAVHQASYMSCMRSINPRITLP